MDILSINLPPNTNQDELIRQVTIGCVEQGLLLFRVRNELRMTLSHYRKAYRAAVEFGLRKSVGSQVELEKVRFQVRHTPPTVSDIHLILDANDNF